MSYEIEKRKHVIQKKQQMERVARASRPEHDTANLQRALGNEGVAQLVRVGQGEPRAETDGGQVARDSLQGILNRQVKPGTVPAGTIQKMDGDDDLSHLMPQLPNLLKRGNMARRERRGNGNNANQPNIIANPPNNDNHQPIVAQNQNPPAGGWQRRGNANAPQRGQFIGRPQNNNTADYNPPVNGQNAVNIVEQAPLDRKDALEEDKNIKLLATQAKQEQNPQTKLALVQRVREMGLDWIYKYRELAANDRLLKAKMQSMERLVYEEVIHMETELTGQFNEGNVFNPNFGSGMMGSVQGVEYGGGEQRVFKPAENRYGDEVAKAQAAGIPQTNTRLANRNVAMSRLDQLFGTNAIAPTDFAMQGGKFGTAQQLAAGKSPQKWRENPEKREMFKDDPNANPTMWKDEHVRDFDFSDPLVQKGLADLSLIDAVAGQIDRNWGNYFINQPGGEQQSQVTGIDNDLAFGVNTTAQPAKWSGSSFEGLGQLMDNQTVQRFMAITEQQIRLELRPLLPPEEIEATIQRWQEVRGQLETMLGNHRVVGGGGDNPSQWGAETHAASTQPGAASSYLKTATDMKTALGQHHRVIGKDE